MKIFASLFFAAVICAGCAQQHYTRGSGDAGQFILQRAVAYGGSPKSTTGLPAVAGHWSYSEDAYGVVIHLSREQRPALELLLLQAFGQPQFGSFDMVDGKKLAAYRLTPKGGEIQFSSGDKDTQIIVIHPFSKKKESE